MDITDYGVWITFPGTRKTSSIPLTKNSHLLDQPIETLGRSFFLRRNGKAWAYIHKKPNPETKWHFLSISQKTSIQSETMFEPLTIKDALRNISPWIFTCF